MKSMIFDTGPIISLALNNLLWVLDPLKKKFKGNFYITKSVKKEIIDRPLNSKKFKFEALQVLHLYEKNVIELTGNDEIEIQAQVPTYSFDYPRGTRLISSRFIRSKGPAHGNDDEHRQYRTARLPGAPFRRVNRN